MRGLKFALAVLGTSLVLVLGIGAAGYYAVSNAFASGFGPFGDHGAFAEHALPPELRGLEQLPPTERFKHFNGAQITLKDINNQSMTVNVTPGTVSSVSATSLTLTANDGSTKTYTLDDQTIIRGKPDMSTPGNRPAPTTLKQGDMVVAVSKNSETAARFVMSAGTEGFGPPRGGHGPFGGPFGAH